MSDKNRIIIFDTTMRDGEQSPGATMSLEEKIQIARCFDELGIDVIEAGFPIASPGDCSPSRIVVSNINIFSLSLIVNFMKTYNTIYNRECKIISLIYYILRPF